MDKEYAVDEIIDDKVILQNSETGEITTVDLANVPDNLHDGSILIYNGKGYVVNFSEEKLRREKIRQRIEQLKALRNKENEEDAEDK